MTSTSNLLESPLGLCYIECTMSFRELQLKSRCFFVQVQPEIVCLNLYRQSGAPELLFELALTEVLLNYVHDEKSSKGRPRSSCPPFRAQRRRHRKVIWDSQASPLWFSFSFVLLQQVKGAFFIQVMECGDVLFTCTHNACAVGLGEMRSYVCFYIQNLLC